MERKKVIPIWLSSIFVTCILFSMCLYVHFCVQKMSAYTWGFALSALFYCAACLCALFYCFTGYKKNSAQYFRLFCLMYSAYQLVLIVFLSAGYTLALPIAALTIGYGIANIFTVAENLRKLNSYILALVNIVMTIASMIYGLTAKIAVICYISNLLLAIIFGLMVYAKYRDKSARGTI